MGFQEKSKIVIMCLWPQKPQIFLDFLLEEKRNSIIQMAYEIANLNAFGEKWQ